MKYLPYALVIALGLIGCNSTESEASASSTSGAVFNPDLPSSAFQSETDAAKRQTLMTEMWTALSAPTCWDASFVGPSTPSGYAASVSQFTFSGSGDYRYVGFETHVGSLSLVDLGHYQGKPAALISSWSGETEGIILDSKEHFEHVLTNPSGALYAVSFWTSRGPCL